MARFRVTRDMLPLVSERFRALADPARLELLVCLRSGEHAVGELVEATGMGQANVSKHLQHLYAAGFVKRRREGLFVRYCLADRDVLALCDMMCGRVQRESKARVRLVT
jgi:DNA-binding transcriptional ArsR family regulator